MVLAIAQPGNLGGTETAAATTTSSLFEETTVPTSAVESTTTTATAVVTATSVPRSSSGLGTGGSGSVPNGTASNTGGPAWLLPIGGGALVAGLSTRRLARAAA